MEKIFVTPINYKELMYEIHKESLQISEKMTANTKEKCEPLNRCFWVEKKKISKGQRHLKRYLKSQIIREMQIKTITRHHFISTRMAKIKRPTLPSVDKDVDNRYIYMVLKECRLLQRFGKFYSI